MLLVAMGLCLGSAACAAGMVRVGAAAGAEPVCPYGYFDVSPYSCAPLGYYGPEWFDNGEFIGAGPWFHDRRSFHGYVDNRFHPDHGYRGVMPARGERHPDGWRPDRGRFQGNEMRDGRGHVVRQRR